MNISALASSRRPHSLKEVVQWGLALGDMDSFLREFLDEFYSTPSLEKRQNMLEEEPPLVEELRTNAYLAAVAEHLARQDHLIPPQWVSAEVRFLKRPFFPCGLESLKATLLVESPNAFRRRLIFVGAEPLYRPRKNSAVVAT